MRRASIILLTSATLAVSLAATAPASADDRFCAQWLYGQSLVHDVWGWHYELQRLTCKKWVVLSPPQPGFHFGAGPTPWVTERDFKASKLQQRALNPQPIPPGKKKKKVKRTG